MLIKQSPQCTIDALKRRLMATLSASVGNDEARAMATEILCYRFDCDAVHLVINGDRVVEPQTVAWAEDCAARVVAGRPLQYVLGTAWFAGRRFAVDDNVLIPRPETAQLTDVIIDACRGRKDLRVLDLGTGSGCIAVTIALGLKFADVTAIDISEAALSVAAANAAAHRARVHFKKADMLDAASLPDGVFDVIVSNPPYIADSERDGMDARVRDHEPCGALFVPDADPLLFYKAVSAYALRHLVAGGLLFFEINSLFADRTRKLLEAQPWASVEVGRDYKGNLRFAICRL